MALTFLLYVPLRAADQTVIVTYGDSLSAGFGLTEQDAFPAQLEKALRAKGHNVRIVNASVSGDTTAAGLARFDWSFPDGAQGVILELGANDALRGLPPDKTRSNLDQLITRIKAKGAEPLLAGMLAPRNLGVKYTQAFDSIYPELAKKHGILLYPFFLYDVAGKKKLNLSDGLHPNPAGIKRIVEQIVPKVEELLNRISARSVKTQ
ncbi:MAG: arylesterase [Hyphomicrobiaceae bacterium]|nr:arylesterase [Hyphomicrobiaceae bacterium]